MLLDDGQEEHNLGARQIGTLALVSVCSDPAFPRIAADTLKDRRPAALGDLFFFCEASEHLQGSLIQSSQSQYPHCFYTTEQYLN